MKQMILDEIKHLNQMCINLDEQYNHLANMVYVYTKENNLHDAALSITRMETVRTKIEAYQMNVRFLEKLTGIKGGRM